MMKTLDDLVIALAQTAVDCISDEDKARAMETAKKVTQPLRLALKLREEISKIAERVDLKNL